jgi:hypothetical protein
MIIFNDKPWMENVRQDLLLRLWRKKDDGSVFQWRSAEDEFYVLATTKYGEIWIADAAGVAENQCFAKVQPDEVHFFSAYTFMKVAKKVVENFGGKFTE